MEYLNVGLIRADGKVIQDSQSEIAKKILVKEDNLILINDAKEGNILNKLKKCDIVFVFNACGFSPLFDILAKTNVPSMAIEEFLGFHTYHSTFYREMERKNGAILPAITPEDISFSIKAVRAKKFISGKTLLLIGEHQTDFRDNMVNSFSKKCKEKIGINIVQYSVDKLKKLAKKFSDKDADDVLKQWYEKVLEYPSEMSVEHMRQVSKLYLAEKEFILETKAIGVTVDDINGFLISEKLDIMPNVTYGPLSFEGYLACEEGDIEVLTSELLIFAAIDKHPTMSNIYLTYRDRFDALESYKDCTAEVELEDLRQCIKDNHVTLCHFSGAGVLNLDMMEEKKYRVRETLPAWPGQSMIISTPRLGKIVMARICSDVSQIHLIPGEITYIKIGDKYGWYRGRYFIKIPSVPDFINKSFHPHYAIGPENNNFRVLQILCGNILRLKLV